ncbi:hypothetical protein BDV95DRAFT_587559 [Massariosphaeria phaeospora]|uniref:F-box domain-containing protein n=1 Tax=Massariosphaeria phaeospora TaxID=100035 RepID=A0A7C8LZU5_9PLEO|nr:hypothetical protein BDV95DRAFT_587559 [Massariosphaeria phaeospora]
MTPKLLFLYSCSLSSTRYELLFPCYCSLTSTLHEELIRNPLGTAMSYIEMLPRELSDAIYEYADLGLSDLSRLSRTSKDIRQSLLPEMYESITMVWNGKQLPSDAPRLGRLVRSLINNPKLRALIKNVSLQAESYPAFRDVKATRKQEMEGGRQPYVRIDKPEAGLKLVGATLDRTLNKMQLANIPRWKKALSEGNTDATIALLLSQCTQVESLKLGDRILSNNDFVPEMLRHICDASGSSTSTTMTKFARLQHVKLAADHHVEWSFLQKLRYDISVPLAFFQFPAMEEITAWVPDVYKDKRQRDTSILELPWSKSMPATMTHLRVLRLRATLLSPKSLEAMLLRVPCLTSLEYDYWADYQNAPFDCAQLGRALVPLRRTLRHLTVAFTSFVHYPVDANRELGDYWLAGSIGPLSEFTKLETLEIETAVLFGWKRIQTVVLPALQLKTVHLTDFIEGFAEYEWEDLRAEELGLGCEVIVDHISSRSFFRTAPTV